MPQKLTARGEQYQNITSKDLLDTAAQLFRKGNRNTLNYLSQQNSK